MPLEYSFALEVHLRALEPSVMAHLSRIIDDNPGWDTLDRARALEAILDEVYPEGYREWYSNRVALLRSQYLR